MLMLVLMLSNPLQLPYESWYKWYMQYTLIICEAHLDIVRWRLWRLWLDVEEGFSVVADAADSFLGRMLGPREEMGRLAWGLEGNFIWDARIWGH